MAITVLYTDTDAIRGAIGVDEADIDDAVITGQNMALQMTAELEKFLPNHSSVQFSNLKIPDQLNLWCMWFGAWRLAQSPLATPKKLSTGKDEYERFNIDWEALEKVAYKNVCAMKDLLLETTSTVVAETAAYTVMGAATPCYNPITGSSDRSQVTEGNQ